MELGELALEVEAFRRVMEIIRTAVGEILDLAADDHECGENCCFPDIRARVDDYFSTLGEGGRTRKAGPLCAWPGCGDGTGDLFCRKHWYLLPQYHREAARAMLAWLNGQA